MVKARQYFQEALSLNPSDKTPHIYIASMYASSANSCGDTTFNKQAVFWLAAQEASKAGSAGAKYAESYNAKAPLNLRFLTKVTKVRLLKLDVGLVEV